MATKQQQIFSKIVLHNKLMNQATIDRLLGQLSDPEEAINFLIKKGKIPDKKGTQLLTLYRKQLEKAGLGTDQSDAGDDAGFVLLDDVESDPSPEAPATDDPPAGAEDYGGLPPLKVDLDDDEGEVSQDEDDEEDLPVLERDSGDSDGDRDDERNAPQPPAPAAQKASAPAKASGPVKPAGPINPLIQQIFQEARALGASDVHIKSGEIPIVRLAGSLRELEGHKAMEADGCRAALLTMLNSEQREIFEDTGDLDFCYDGGEELGRFRSNLLNQHRGTDGIFRLISTEIPSFDDLHLPPTVKTFTEYKQGIILITGPKGSGKTTTLAAMVDMINRTRPEHIITVEDPIEYVHPCKMGHVNQREVGRDTKKFSNALKAALREAPDVIMVGEMRDLETTSLAITAAETGHLVFATLHTPDAVRTIDRVLDVFPPKEQGQIRSMVSESMRGILSQLLVPSVDGKSQELAVEIMVNTSAIGNLIRESKTFQLRGVMQTGRKLGMVLMDDSLVTLAKAGRIKREDALALAAERKQVEESLDL